MTQAERMTPRDWVVLALIMIAGAALRSMAIGSEALWSDEALTYVLAQAPASALAHAPLDPTAPLYYWLHQLLIADGAGVIAGRSIALAAGVLTIPTVYFFGRAIAGSGGAALAGAWVAVSAPLIDYSQEARAYALLVLLIMLSASALHAALRGAGRRRSWALAGFTLSSILAIYTHLVAFFWVAPALLILLIENHRQAGGIARRAWLPCVVIAVAAIPELQRAVRYATQNNAFHWLKQPDFAGLVDLVLRQWLPLGALTLSVIAAAVLLLAALWRRGALGAWAARNRAAALILAALLLQPLALWLFGFWISPIVMARTILPSLAAVGLAAAVVMTRFDARASAVGGVAVLGAMLGTTLIGGTIRPKEEWSRARAVLARADPARDLIIACPFWKAPALMAATRGLRSAPLVTPFLDHMRLIERQLGVEQRWEGRYYERVFVTLNARALGIVPPIERRMSVPVRSLFVVASECSPDERRAIAGWADDFVIEERWIAAPRADHAGIVIERWTLARARRVNLTVAR